ncbi:RraA family protein [Muricoccus radiodurans]|uniref:RraA family protein n=1 Tax=Muricoccus radiodurans TaxID=2231721 RepID=UPI003CF21FC3
MKPEKTLTGRVPREAVRRMELPPLDPALLDRLRALEDLTGALSDAMDDLGLFGAVPASVLRPTLPGKRIVGQAVTVRNAERPETPTEAARIGKSGMGEHEAYNLAEPGNVVVIEGLAGVSNMGGQSATLAHRSGLAGAVIDGSHRDPDASRENGFPIWSRGVTPITGKWRLRTVEVNGPVRIGGVLVEAGDVVAADEAGIVFIPLARVEEVLREAERIDAGDTKQKGDIASGVDLGTLARTKYK